MARPTADEVQGTLERALELCAGVQQAELVYSASGEALSRFANNDIQQNLSQESIELSLTLVENDRIGQGSTNRLDDEGLARLVAGARQAAALQRPESGRLPLVARCPTAHKDSLDPATADLDPETKAAAIAETFQLARDEGLEASGIYSNAWSLLALANSAGLRCSYRNSSASFSTTFHGADSSGWAEQEAPRAAELKVGELSREARRIALSSANPRPAQPGPWTVILPPAAVADLLLMLNWLGFGGQDFVEGTGPLAGKAGRKLFHESLQIVDDADDPRTEGMPFDFEGLPRRRTVLVDRGVFLGPVHDRTTAARAGVESTGHGFSRPNPHGPFPGNLVMAGGDSSLGEMIRGTKRGLLVTHLHYTNVQDPNEMRITGMTRDGLFFVEEGEVRHAVRNMRFTVSLFEVFSRIAALTREQAYHGGFFGGGFVLPGMLVEGFAFTSESGF
jgi:PmbA protein